jgi:hypothetical protein
MFITFDVSKFAGNPKGLTNLLYNLRHSANPFDQTNPEITEITCRTPSSAFRYVRYVATSGLTEKAERVFLKNPNIGIRYLSFIRRKHFLNEDTQKRFWKKVIKCPYFSYTWANNFKTRLTETEEEIFVENVKLARDYAYFVIKGRFPEKIHNMLVLKSFELKDGWEKKNLQEYIQYAGSNK